ncbi:MAG: hypothetical protein DI626_02660 [Micavibrio aeruginosavorus]|uniref:Uncharacterized protein n=1 Tax=Micavibrio aeruginosavorus TaxID=349221 RepID=A0A2W5A6F6_9BACT|nr:MAG: hypothetical protein DI626_02660 [Micavibrio aeruginosavorus]
MIRRIGFKRLVALIALSVILVGLVLFNNTVVEPQTLEGQRKIRAVTTEMGTLNDELTVMRDDYARFMERKETFERMTRTGFFNDQERVRARERFDTIRELSKVISARYELRAAMIEQNDDIKDTGYVIMRTSVSINLAALTDIDIYRFVYYLTYAYPGQISISSLVVKRERKIDQETLREIGTGKMPEIVTGRVEFMWTTMAKKEAVYSPADLLREEQAAAAAQGGAQ